MAPRAARAPPLAAAAARSRRLRRGPAAPPARGAAARAAAWAPLAAALAACAAPRPAAAEVPINTPMQVVMPTRDHEAMVPNTETLQAISQHKGRISVVAVVGPYHSGKSFLLNALVGQTNVFSVGRKTSPETMGIWLCRTTMRASDGSEVWLLDSEGFFGPGVSETYDAKVFTIASLIGAHLVYNTVKVIDQQAVTTLEMLARRAQLFRTKSSAEQSGVVTPEFLSVRNFPPLTWVVEDFFQEIPEQYQRGDAATAWLRSYLSRLPKLDASDDGVDLDEDGYFLSKLYSELKVHTLFLPATSRADLQDLSRMSWDHLTPEFRDELAALRHHILHRLTARTFEGKAMTGQTLGRCLGFMVQALRRGMFHELPSLWATWTQHVAEISLQDAERWFSDLLDSIDTQEDLVRLSVFNTQVEEARGKAVRFYADLLHDFIAQPDEVELHRRMTPAFEKKKKAYHGRVFNWVHDSIAAAEKEVSDSLASKELPEDPPLLEERSKVEMQAARERFSQKIAGFKEEGPPSQFYFAVQWPFLSEDPQERLASDPLQQLDRRLTDIHLKRATANKQRISEVFAMAEDAAYGAVEREIAVRQTHLLGKAKMKELKEHLRASCWEAFHGNLAQGRWMWSTEQYSISKDNVETNIIARRLTKLAVDNDQAIKEHFSSALNVCKNHYKAQRSTLPMPVAEETLEFDHKVLSDRVRGMLDERSKHLADTDHFVAARQSLERELAEGLGWSKKKNIDIWKVESDEATRCARKENRAALAKCGFTCLFNKVPRVHRSMSQRHLYDCFQRVGGAQKMPPRLQYQIFENWYATDVSREAADVSNYCYSAGGVAVVAGLVSLRFFGPWAQNQNPPAPYQTGGFGRF